MPNSSIGIDAGGTLIKIAYEENGRLLYRKYPAGEMESAMGWLQMFSFSKRIVLTGGRAGKVKSLYFPDAELIDEFTAACNGAKFLMDSDDITFNEKVLLVNIGTGTSWFIMDQTKSKRILGSGFGGGTLMGLGRLLGDIDNYEDLTELALQGNRESIDMMVKDIYEPDTPPIPGDLTASNFAKASTGEHHSVSDIAASLMNLLSETIILLTVQAATLHNIKKAVFIGSTLSGNKALKENIAKYGNMSDLETVFLKNGEYSGAIGAKMF